MSDVLDLSPPLRIRGQRRRPIHAEFDRPLEEADLALLDEPRGHKPRPLQRFRDSHHRLARCIAAGMGTSRAAIQCGYSANRVSTLVNDPAFQNLVEVYRSGEAETLAEFHSLAYGNMVKAERHVGDSLDKLEDRAEPLDLAELRPLLDIISDRADRFGHPKASASLNVNVDFASRLDRAIERANKAKLIEPSHSAGLEPSSRGGGEFGPGKEGL
jgi:hypothetical protein